MVEKVPSMKKQYLYIYICSIPYEYIDTNHKIPYQFNMKVMNINR